MSSHSLTHAKNVHAGGHAHRHRIQHEDNNPNNQVHPSSKTQTAPRRMWMTAQRSPQIRQTLKAANHLLPTGGQRRRVNRGLQRSRGPIPSASQPHICSSSIQAKLIALIHSHRWGTFTCWTVPAGLGKKLKNRSTMFLLNWIYSTLIFTCWICIP